MSRKGSEAITEISHAQPRSSILEAQRQAFLKEGGRSKRFQPDKVGSRMSAILVGELQKRNRYLAPAWPGYIKKHLKALPSGVFLCRCAGTDFYSSKA